MAADDLDSLDKREFWRMLKDPLHAELLGYYKKNKKVFAEEDERITQDITDSMTRLNKKLGRLDK